MRSHRLVLIGFGHVGRALLQLLEQRRELLKRRYGVQFAVNGVATGRHGCAVNPAGLDAAELLARGQRGESLAPLSVREVGGALDVIAHSGADVLVELSPLNPVDGQPALEHCRAALQAGMHAITANKGALVFGHRSLSALAAARGRRFLFEGTVLGGAPLFSVFRKSLPALEVSSFRGVLNSTTNVILTRMERGESLEQAVAYCQSVGLTETDPSADIDGWDAAVKVAALATVLMETPLAPDQVERSGIRGLSAERLAATAAQGLRWKLICAAERVGAQVKARVGLEAVSAADPLYALEGSSNGVSIRSDLLGDYVVIEAEREGLIAGPGPTAYSVFADLLDAVGAERSG